MLAKAVSGIDHQRRTHDQQRVGLAQRSQRRLDALARHRIAEEHHVGLEYPAALRAIGNSERIKLGRLDIGVAIGSDRCGGAQHLWIRQLQHLLHAVPRHLRMAIDADNARNVAVQFDHCTASRALVQAIDVLRHQAVHVARGFEASQRRMCGVGPRV